MDRLHILRRPQVSHHGRAAASSSRISSPSTPPAAAETTSSSRTSVTIQAPYLGSSPRGCDEKEKQDETMATLTNNGLLVQIISLVGLLEEICKRPDSLHTKDSKLVDEIMVFVCEDYFSAINGVSIRVSEFRERLSGLKFGESVELVCALTRLENCKEKMSELSTRKRAVMESFWATVSEIKGGVRTERDEGKLVIRLRREMSAESSRFPERVLRSGDSVRFNSGRLGQDGVPITIF
ncbi:hypothetical protein CJ030_MR5G010404 [Morella rubra]|uniref:Uncharacterized protein n=1 Tax=Morella rubra TaxID=262757 RepID=A0A6A1VNW0_9ROSI|nr:hypothetical protein CJ030_MR5G010404 [Morella rubra]